MAYGMRPQMQDQHVLARAVAHGRTMPFFRRISRFIL